MTLKRSELRSWLRLVRGIGALFDALDRHMRDEMGMSHDDYVILSHLHRQDGKGVRMSDLARVASFSPSRVSHAAGRLEDKGWLRRSPSKADGRIVQVGLTDAGVAKVREASPDHLALVKELVFDTLGPGLARDTADALDRIRRRAESGTRSSTRRSHDG